MVNFLQKILYLIFGILGMLFGTVTFIWVFYNLFSGNMHPVFKKHIGDDIIYSVLYIAGGLTINWSMITIGKEWIIKSEFLKMIKFFKKKDEQK